MDRGRRSSPGGCSSSATRSSRSTGSGAPTSRRSSPAATASPTRRSQSHVQLPHDRAGARRGSTTCSASSSSPSRARSPSTARSRPRAPTPRRAVRAWCCSAPSRTATMPDAASSCASAKPPTSRRRSAARSPSGGRSTTATTVARRRGSATSASCCRRARRSASSRRALDDAGDPVPRRDELARLRQPRGPRPAHGAARGRRPERQLALVDGAAVVGVRLRRRRPLRRSTSSTAAAGTSPRPPPETSARTTIPVADGDARTSPALHDERAWVDAERAARAHRARAARARGRRGRRPVPRRRAARPVRRRPGARVRRTRAGGTLRDYLAWATLQGTEGARVVETVLPETDDDAVRIMTIHGAKGLEFPIVIVLGHDDARAQARRGGVQVLFPPAGGCEVRLATGVQTDAVRAAPADRRADGLPREAAAPLRRVHARARSPRRLGAPRRRATLGRRVADVDARRAAVERGAERAWFDRASLARADAAARATAPARRRRIARRRGRPSTTPAFATRRRRRGSSPRPRCARARPTRPPSRRSRRREGRPRSRAAAVEQGPLRHRDRARGARGAADRRPRDRRRARRRRRRAGRGRRRARARGDDRRARARRARQRRPCSAAAARPHWRETYVAVPVEGITLEGYVDLVYRDDDGLVVVDYKTDAIGDAADARPPLAHYRIQGAAYALAVAATRRASRSSRACSCSSTRRARARSRSPGADLAAAIAEVRRLVAEPSGSTRHRWPRRVLAEA